MQKKTEKLFSSTVLEKLDIEFWEPMPVPAMDCFIYILDIQILVQSHFELVSSVLALEATELVSEPVTQMTVELINNHLISVQQER